MVTGVIVAPIFHDGPPILWFASAGLAVLGVQLITSGLEDPRKRENKAADDDDDGIEIETDQKSGSRDSSRHDHDGAPSDDTDSDSDND